MNVSFLSPLFLAGLAALAIPVLLHLFKQRPDPVLPFSAVRLLRAAPVEQARRRKIRDLLLLALRAVAVALLALSFARPYVATPGAAGTAPITIIGMDTSYSVSTPAQVDRARSLARQALGAAPAGGSVALVAFDDRAEVRVGPTTDRGAVAQAITTISPGAGGTRYAALFAAAADLAGGREARLAIVSDLQQRGWTERGSIALPASMVVQALDVGPASGDLGVATVERAGAGVSVSVRSTWAASRSTRIVLSVDGRPVAEQVADVPPQGEAVVSIPATLPVRGLLRASIDDPGGYSVNDERFAVLDPAGRPRVLAVTSAGPERGEAFYFERAMGALDNGGGFDLVRLQTGRAAAADQLDGFAAIILFGTVGLERSTLEAIARAPESGTGLLVVTGPTLELSRVAVLEPFGSSAARADAVPGLTFAPVDVRHPVFRSFSESTGLLGSVRFTRVVRLPRTAGTRVLARLSDGTPALLEEERTGTRGRLVVMTSDVSNAWNDFALHPAFVPFVHDLVRHVASIAAPPREARVGDRLAGRVQERSGVVEIGPAGRPSARVAVNVDPAEADGARLPPEVFLQQVPRGQEEARSGPAPTARAAEREQSLWRYGLIVMLAALVLESAVGRKV